MQQSVILTNRDNVVVFYGAEQIVISKSVAERMHLQEGYRIQSDKELWTIVAENARQDISIYTSYLKNQGIVCCAS